MSKRVSWVLPAAAGGLFAFNSVCALEAAGFTIRHDSPACVLAGAFPRLVGEVDPPGQAARVRVAFRPEASELWHGVTAEVTDSGFAALLPRPRPAARRIHYRFEASGRDAAVVTTPEYTVTVVENASACDGAVAESVPSATVMVDVPPGAPLVPPVPAGFDPVGAVSSAPHKATSKKKVGLLAGVVVGAGAVAAGVAAGSSDASTPPTMLQPAFLRIQSSSPPFFSDVSVAANNMTLEVAVSTPRTLQPGEAWIILFHPVNHPAEQPCAVLAGPHPLLEAGREGRFVVRTPFLHAIPCGLSTSARVIFRTTSGQQILESGGPNWLDGSAVYTWIP